jgi:hypothetical protein
VALKEKVNQWEEKMDCGPVSCLPEKESALTGIRQNKAKTMPNLSFFDFQLAIR